MRARKGLWRAVERAKKDPFYLAWALDRFAEAEGLDEAGLARFLGCAEEDLPLLGLCRRPVSEPPERFRGEVEAIARRWGLGPDRLAHLLRLVDVLATWAGQQPSALLLAARDREREREDGDHGT